MESGCDIKQARRQIHLVDSEGLITSHRSKLAHHKKNFAHELHKYCATLEDAVDVIKPTVLIGVSASSGAFNKHVLNKLVEHTPLAPVVFALSNPTSKAECTAAQAYEWTNGQCIFASGSPFDPLELHDGTKRIPGQGNNAYIFPALALAAISVEAKHLTDSDMYVAAKALSGLVSKERLKLGCVYPSLDEIRKVSLTVATAVAENIYERGDAALLPKPADLREYIQSTMYDPSAGEDL
jgi:malate dehydrogenase (oxaloacetate-decarboxylating)(NADP+)